MRAPAFQASRHEDGSTQLAWDRDEHHLDIDLSADGTFEWFYRNRETGEVLGTQYRGEPFDPEAFLLAVHKLHGTK